MGGGSPQGKPPCWAVSDRGGRRGDPVKAGKWSLRREEKGVGQTDKRVPE